MGACRGDGVILGSLFSGIGGLDLAVERALGAKTAWQVEYEPAPASILERHWPDAARYQDINDIDWLDVEPVDVLCGGYPCQPFSHAGLRKGTDDPRHLWPRFADAIGVLRPRYALLENVAGHLSLGFDTVLADLAALGYDATWTTLRAADIGAPHGRKRLFVLAADTTGTERGEPEQQGVGTGPEPTSELGERLGTSADTSRERYGRGQDSGGVGRVDREDAEQAWERERPRQEPEHRGAAVATDADSMAWGDYAPAIQRWERVIGRSAPEPAINGWLNPRFVEWMMGFDAGWVDGLTRAKALKALGNAVVPQQGEAAIRMLTRETVTA